VVLGTATAPSFDAVHAIAGCNGTIARLVGLRARLLTLEAPVTVEDVISRDAPLEAIAVWDSAIGGAAVLRRLDLRGGAVIGVSAHLLSHVSIEDLVIVGVRWLDRAYPTGVVLDTPTSELRRAHIEGVVVGLMVQQGQFTAEDVSFASLAAGGAETPSAGLVAFGWGSVVGRRVLVDGPPERGVWIANYGATELDDVLVRDLGSSRATGLEVNAHAGPSVVRRLEIAGGLGTGVAIQGSVTIEDLSVHDLGADEAPARGIVLAPTTPEALVAPVVRLTRTSVLDVEGSGVRARVPRGMTPARWSARLDDLRVARITRPTCSTDACDEPVVGIEVSGELDAMFSRFVVRDVADRGIDTADGATLAGAEGLVAAVPSCGALTEPAPTVVFAACGP
jgi:hypothetical protein